MYLQSKRSCLSDWKPSNLGTWGCLSGPLHASYLSALSCDQRDLEISEEGLEGIPSYQWQWESLKAKGDWDKADAQWVHWKEEDRERCQWDFNSCAASGCDWVFMQQAPVFRILWGTTPQVLTCWAGSGVLPCSASGSHPDIPGAAEAISLPVILLFEQTWGLWTCQRRGKLAQLHDKLCRTGSRSIYALSSIRGELNR